jgi:glycerol-1-phosphate dehydrogenase [NAD(P)+]
MHLTYDPAENELFWKKAGQIPGYPKNEEMPIRSMTFESDAIFRLPEVLANLAASPKLPVLVVMDPTPMRRGPDDLKSLVVETLRRAGWQPETVVLAPDASGQVHTDMPHIEAVKARLQPRAAVLSVGSGVVTDIAKHACYLFEKEHGNSIPLVVYQTANSVSAFTSNMAVCLIDGVKRTQNSRYPDALVCDLETLRDAPYEMTAAGMGDLLAAFVSFPDWYLAHTLGMDPGYMELPQTLMGPLDEIFLDQAKGIRSGDLTSVAVVAKMISLGGLAMSLSHATTPLSGYEHVMSHVLDMINEQTGRPLALHGTQVALAAILGAGVYRQFLAEFDPSAVDVSQCYPAPDAMRAIILKNFATVDPSGKAGEECWSDYRQKLDAWHAHRADFERFLKDWPAISQKIHGFCRPPERLIEILRAIGSPLSFQALTPPFDDAQVRFAFLNASLMRKRLTIGDLLIFLGWDRERLWRRNSRYVIATPDCA